MQVRRGQLTILRQRAGLSKKALAEIAGISKSALGQIEAGRNGAAEDTVWRLAQALSSRLNYKVDVGEIAVLGQPEPVADAS